MSQSMLIFSVALNGYQWLYKSHLNSHRQYAQRIGAKYSVVSRPYFSRSGVECCWYKLFLLKRAIESGYKHVLFLDADSFVQDDCPDIRNECDNEHSVYMAKGYTQRFNSGVLLCKGNEQAAHFLQQVIGSREQVISETDSVGWGENGHVIACAKQNANIKELHHKWNNTHDLDLNDYIRHTNFGPLRQNALLNLCHKTFNRITTLSTQIQTHLLHIPMDTYYQQSAVKELRQIFKLYPEFSNSNITD